MRLPYRMKCVHLIISGRVQGVGFRDWLTAEANRRQLSGWVRNAGGDRVEAVIAGPAATVDACVQLCHQGPPLACVSNVTVSPAQPPDRADFLRRASIPP